MSPLDLKPVSEGGTIRAEPPANGGRCWKTRPATRAAFHPHGDLRMFGKFLKNARRGFTLVEIMIVVLIIGILLAIAVPNFIKARETSRAKACVANLKQIDSAKEQWCMDNKQSTTATPADTDLYGNTAYVKNTPSCPSG